MTAMLDQIDLTKKMGKKLFREKMDILEQELARLQ